MVADPPRKKISTVPFPAIVGQESLKRVLLIAGANDDLGGVLLSGEKGTAKSTAVRSFVDLLPRQRAVADCAYGCSPDDPAAQCADCRDRDDPPVETRSVPLVTLPLGATRDRVVGTLSIEDALAGEADFDPGLLARANRGFLYVDEINLLDDHLVDVLLDAAASGVNVVERDGVSVSHPSRFALIGTMNPEEGDLRPQLRDRFDLRATVEGCRDVADRVEIIERALTRTDDGRAFAAEYDESVAALGETVSAARGALPSVTLPAELKRTIAELCLDAGVDGHRADIATARAAIALAALDGRTTVIESDVREAASYALPHRLRSTPFEEPPDPDELLDEHFDERGDASDGDADPADDGDGENGNADADGDGDADADGDADGAPDQSDGDGDGPTDRPESASDPPPEAETEAPGDGSSGGSAGDRDADGDAGDSSDGAEEAAPVVPGQRRAEIGEGRSPEVAAPDAEGADGGRGTRVGAPPTVGDRGLRVRTEPATGDDPVDAAASVRAAVSRGSARVESRDLRRTVRTSEASSVVVFAVDASASMRPAMRAAKGVVLDFLRGAYRRRDEVAFVAFAGEDADVLLPPTRSVSLAARHLKELPTGDRTPLPAGLDTARRVIDRADSDASVVVLVTDGRANVSDGSPTAATRRAARRLAAAGAHVVVVDAASDRGAGLSGVVAEETDGETVPLSALTPEVVEAALDAAGEGRSR
ncbi:VWA domain-containing protein [Halomarina halobia]|uniref:VWA domain-containing protein n=1 Tax=Halomarina halobia TaxID=3033386 RepID=A0ABD6A4U3_9EURY|nr:VWA domain-containing protein [Halomarina sp. PSR21]